eukprot:TRINITY_DN3270_c0_g1_i11.p1 TRINITY_DN3270_c0_g1~~TRINITY_DN3270_c0_g1_i11.p1  ORF type:complete len:263 (+),score=30.68 TRINITY_DN3270_c0_g1_i11:80-868(+)
MAQNNRKKPNGVPNVNYEEDLDRIDFDNYKGMFYDDPDQKYQDPITGAHFDYLDMCSRLIKLQKSLDIQHDTSYISQKPEEEQVKSKGRNPLGQLRQLLERRKQKESRNATHLEYGTMKFFHEDTHNFNSYIATQNAVPHNHSNNKHEGNVRSKSTDKGPQNTTFYNAAKKMVNPRAYESSTQKNKKQSLLELYLELSRVGRRASSDCSKSTSPAPSRPSARNNPTSCGAGGSIMGTRAGTLRCRARRRRTRQRRRSFTGRA